jgi:hypothetical protein
MSVERVRGWGTPAIIGLLCAVFGLSVHLAGWLVGYRLFEQGRGCAGADESGYEAAWVAAAVVGVLAAPVLAWFAGRSLGVSGARAAAAAATGVVVLALPYC